MAVQPENGPLILPAGHGTVLTARGSRMVFKALAGTTGGAFSLMERSLPPGGRPPPKHVHPETTEAFYLLEGRLDFLLDAERTSVTAGGFVLVPGGAAHSFVNVSDQAARVLILHSPALDGYFRELHELWLADQQPTAAQERALMTRHGLVPVPDGQPGPAGRGPQGSSAPN
jgi:quercetin dioxygenase-like cupin family protein